MKTLFVSQPRLKIARDVPATRISVFAALLWQFTSAIIHEHRAGVQKQRSGTTGMLHIKSENNSSVSYVQSFV